MFVHKFMVCLRNVTVEKFVLTLFQIQSNEQDKHPKLTCFSNTLSEPVILSEGNKTSKLKFIFAYKVNDQVDKDRVEARLGF